MSFFLNINIKGHYQTYLLCSLAIHTNIYWTDYDCCQWINIFNNPFTISGNFPSDCIWNSSIIIITHAVESSKNGTLDFPSDFDCHVFLTVWEIQSSQTHIWLDPKNYANTVALAVPHLLIQSIHSLFKLSEYWFLLWFCPHSHEREIWFPSKPK